MLITTPAVILQAFPYGDTSRIVRLATRDHGVQSTIAKGAMRPKSPFGGRLQVLSEGIAQFHHRSTRDLQTLSGFDVTNQHAALATDLGRFAAAAALAELVLRTGHEEPQPLAFAALVDALGALTTVPGDRVPVAALAGLWHMVIVLGFAPVVDQCVRCERPLGSRAWFALAEGGLLCPQCGRGTGRGALGPDDQAALRAFLEGRDPGVVVATSHLAAHRRLFARFVRRHVTDDAPLPALAFWEATT